MATIDRKEIKALFAQAREAQTRGDPARAIALYERINAAHPNLAEVHFNLGQLHGAGGDAAKAHEAYHRAATLKPAEPAIWSKWVDQLRGVQDDAGLKQVAGLLAGSALPRPAIERLLASVGGRTSAVGPLKRDASPRRAVDGLLKLMSAGQFARAETEAARLHARHPKTAVFANILAAARAEQDKHDAAEQAFRTAIALDPDYGDALARFGAFLLNRGRPRDAVSPLRQAAKLLPNHAHNAVALGWACLSSGDLDGAAQAFRRAETLGASSARLSFGLGKLAVARKQDGALAHLDQAAAQGLDSVDLHRTRALALQAAGQEVAALQAFDAALARAPDSAALLADKARLLQHQGQFGAARDLIARALLSEPDNGSLYLLYVSGKAPDPDDPVVARARNLCEARPQDRHLAFARARIAEMRKENPFPYLRRANELTRAAFGYDFDADAAEAARVRDAFSPDLREGWAGLGAHEPQPIFVTGLPRSGTTLVERIIAAHSQVAPGGELGMIGRDMRALLSGLADGDRGPDLKPIAQSYWQRLVSRFPGIGRITDKSIASYVHIGFLKLAMPNARIVVVRRDPRDNALSLYKNMFADGQHRYASDLGDIARFMRLFERQVDFWRGVWPEAFTEMRYEDLIADPEAQSRRLIAATGLGWEDACLSFHENAARVDTLSFYQVRQPIYASSVGAWRRHEADMEPFIATYDALSRD